MIYHRDKDVAWVITFTSFLVFLLSAVISSSLRGLPQDIPEPIALANASLGRSFMAVLMGFVRYAALGAMVYGIYGIIRWPPGPHS